MDVSRRHLLRGAAVGAAGTAITAAVLVEGMTVDANAITVAAHVEKYPFHGPHQAGTPTPNPAQKQNFACHVALDVTAKDKDTLSRALMGLTERARFLASGGTPPELGIASPPPDGGVVGPLIPADGLTV